MKQNLQSPSEPSERFCLEYGDTSHSKTPKDTWTCFQIFTILQLNISSQHKTESSPTAIAQPTRNCAANRSSLSNDVARVMSRYKQISLPPLKIFFRNAFVFVCFLKVISSLSLHHVRQTAISNLCSRTSPQLSQHEKFFVVYGNEMSLTVYLSITDSFFLWGSQRKRLIYVDAIFVSVDVPMLYTLSLLTRFIPTKPTVVAQLPFSMNRWIPFFRTTNDNICLFYKWP